MTDSAVEFWFQVPTRMAISRHHTHTLTHHNKANQNNGGASQVALVVKNPPANAGDARDVGLIPMLGRSCGGGNGNPLQYSCLENSVLLNLVLAFFHLRYCIFFSVPTAISLLFKWAFTRV